MTHNPFEKPYADSVPMDPVNQTRATRQVRLRRIARILGWSPFLTAIPVFFIVAELIPDRNHGSIADGFRKLNVFLTVMLPVAGCCWVTAILLTAWLDVPSIPRSRSIQWLAVFVSLIVLTIILVASDL